MEPVYTEVQLKCPGNGDDVSIDLESDERCGCRVVRCTRFGEGRVVCGQGCLDSVMDCPNTPDAAAE